MELRRGMGATVLRNKGRVGTANRITGSLITVSQRTTLMAVPLRIRTADRNRRRIKCTAAAGTCSRSAAITLRRW